MASLESEIVEWSTGRPLWQMSVLCRLAEGEVLRRDDFLDIASRLAAAEVFPESALKPEEMPGSNAGRGRVSLRSVQISEGVNALVAGETLDIPAEGMIVVYGDNGSGKSGFARLLKAVARSRHREDVLSDIFTADDRSGQKAEVAIAVDGVDQRPGSWPEDVPVELQQVGFFDEACGDAYLATESEVTFRPAGIFLLDGLIRACDEVRAELDRRLQENQRRAESLPTVSPGGHASLFLRELSAHTTSDDLDAACAVPSDADSQLERVIAEESRLRGSDPNRERERLNTLAAHYEVVSQHLTALGRQLSPQSVSAAADARSEANELRTAATVASGASFEAEPVPGVGSQAWRALWEAARRFAETEGDVGNHFPAEAESCVLCHQDLGDDAKARFARFEASVRDETERKASEAERNADRLRSALQQVATQPAEVLVSLEQVSDHDHDPEAARRWRDLLERYETVVTSTGDLLECKAAADVATSDAGQPAAAMAAASATRDQAVMVDSSQYTAQLGALSGERTQIEDSVAMGAARNAIEREVARLKDRRQLEEAKRSTDTTGITRKATDLTRSHVTTLVRDRFTRESDRLRLERVTLEDTGGQKGRLQHRPAFVGAVQQPAMARVLSEGEQTALGLAGFFTEAFLDDSRSAIVLDDPVSSLDHIRRGRVATRLAELATERQVVVFTHDLAFVADLARAASESGVSMVERSVERHGDGRLGVCLESHPWKTRDVKSRLGTLEAELATIRREMSSWQQERFEKETADWAGKLSETWERMLSSEVVGRVVDRTTFEVRPKMLKLLARLTEDDEKEFQESYGRISRWARRHDKSLELNYVSPTVDEMEEELKLVRGWFDRIKRYAN